MSVVKRWARTLARINGVSLPSVGGVQWVPPHDQKQTATDILNFLEDRRVLFEPFQMENPRYCIESVLKMRDALTSIMKGCPANTDVSDAGKAIRGACRDFLAKVEKIPETRDLDNFWADPHASSIFMIGLGELRAFIGQEAAVLCEVYELTADKRLRSIFPPRPAR